MMRTCEPVAGEGRTPGQSAAERLRFAPAAGKLQVGICLAALLSPPGLRAADPSIQLNIRGSAGSPGVAEVSFAAPRGTYYRLYESHDLAAWSVRQARPTSLDLSSVRITNDGNGKLFFRVQIVPVITLNTMVWIDAGEFVMGSPTNEVGRFLDKEEPQTGVTLTRGYWMSQYETTQGEFESVLGFNPSLFKGDLQRPVEDVTWFEAVDYCTSLTARERQSGRLPPGFVYRLPTEAEWEYAARAGTTTRYSYGDDPDYTDLTHFAWYNGNSGLRTHAVGQKLPNPWGVYDMHGNVFEWGADWFAQLPGGWVTNTTGPQTGTDRIIRGGYWDSIPEHCRSAMRAHFPPDTRISYLGFRVVLSDTAQ